MICSIQFNIFIPDITENIYIYIYTSYMRSEFHMLLHKMKADTKIIYKSNELQ